MRTPQMKIPSKKRGDGKDEVQIIGKAPGFEKAPKNGHLWGVNDAYTDRKFTLLFEMHDLEKYLAMGKFPHLQKHIDNMNKLGIPVMCQKKYDFIPTSIAYPFDEMPFQYFTSSIAYMVAYAIQQGFKKINTWGIQMATREEYQRQRPCVEFWLGYAMAKGIEVNIGRPSQVLQVNIRGKEMKAEEGLYGIHWDNIGKNEPQLDRVISNQREGVLFTRI